MAMRQFSFGLLAPLRTLVWVLFTSVPAATAVAENWPAWRGDGDGISADRNLPIVWDQSENLNWRTPIEGEGISSPIVWDDRLFVTTSIQVDQLMTPPRVAMGIGITTLVISLLALFLGRTRGANSYVTESGRPHQVCRWIHRFDHVVTAFASALWMLCLSVIFLRENYIEAGSDTIAWNWTSTLAVFAIVAAFGLVDIKSYWRLAGVAMMAGAFTFFLLGSPAEVLTRNARRLLWIITSAAVWWSFLFLLFKRPKRLTPVATEARPRRALAWRTVGVSVVLGMAAWQFVVVNAAQQQGRLQQTVICLDRPSGEILWERVAFRTDQLRRHALNSYATPTPVTDGQYVVADFGANMICLDFAGRVQWQKKLERYEEHLVYGSGCSPVMVGDVVLRTYYPESWNPEAPQKHHRHALLSAFDKRTGEVVWERVLRQGNDSYNTPLLSELRGKPAIFVVTWGYLLAYDPEDGTPLAAWSIPIRQCVPSVVADSESVYVGSGKEHNSQGVVAVNTSVENDSQGLSHISWKVRRSTPEISSPVVYQGLLFMVTDKGIASCLDAETGKTMWRKRLGGNHHASLVCGDGKVYFTSTEGTTTVVAASPEYDELSKNSLSGNVQASIAIADGDIFIRSSDGLYCISSSSESSQPQRDLVPDNETLAEGRPGIAR